VKRLLIQNEDVILYIHVYICYFTGFGIHQYPSSLDKCYSEIVRCVCERERESERAAKGNDTKAGLLKICKYKCILDRLDIQLV